MSFYLFLVERSILNKLKVKIVLSLLTIFLTILSLGLYYLYDKNKASIQLRKNHKRQLNFSNKSSVLMVFMVFLFGDHVFFFLFFLIFYISMILLFCLSIVFSFFWRNFTRGTNDRIFVASCRDLISCWFPWLDAGELRLI